VQNGQDEQATTIIGNIVNALHSNQSPPPPGIPTLRQWFQPLFDQARHHTELKHAAAVADQALTNPQEQRVLHGDIHHENIRQSARGWLAYDPKGLYGERAYDLANTLCNPRPIYGVISTDEGRIMRNANILAQTCGIERSRILLFLYLYAYLTVSWTLAGAATGWEIATISQIANIAERNR
jgi:streptomycin 6-kinase